MSAVLAASGLAKDYGGGRVHAVRDVSLDIAEREVVALVGESGSGKSTTARLLALLERPTAGAISFGGMDARRLRGRALLAYRSHVQMVFQDPFASLNPVKTVGHHLMRPMAIHGIGRGAADRADRAVAALETVGLLPGASFLPRFPHQLSGGQRQRVAVARALVCEPRLILADEPVSMLDVSIRVGLLGLFERLRQDRGLSYLYITHDLATARHFSHRILVMYEGRIVESGAADDVVEAPAHPYTRLLVAAAPDPGREDAEPLPVAGRSDGTAASAAGCVFAARCPLVQEVCRRQPPPRVAVAAAGPGPAHTADCHLMG